MNSITKRLVSSLRHFFAGISEQILYYFALVAAFVAWGYFKSIYAPIIAGIAGVALAWGVSALMEGKDKKKINNETHIQPKSGKD